MQEHRGAGSASGPRVMGRLIPELILRSPQYMNCCQQYELDLRGNRISTIENLGATEVRCLPRSLHAMGGDGGTAVQRR
jgi:hypothetical protein